MTKEEAIKWLKDHHSIDLNTQDDEAHRMSIEALEKLQKIEQILNTERTFANEYVQAIRDIRKVVSG